MNTELLREDERCIFGDLTIGDYLDFLRQRLIEEREKNAKAKQEIDEYRQKAVDALGAYQDVRAVLDDKEAELAEALELVSDAVNHWTGEIWQSDAMALLRRHNL